MGEGGVLAVMVKLLIAEEAPVHQEFIGVKYGGTKFVTDVEVKVKLERVCVAELAKIAVIFASMTLLIIDGQE